MNDIVILEQQCLSMLMRHINILIVYNIVEC
jgi:hypothetical protein